MIHSVPEFIMPNVFQVMIHSVPEFIMPNVFHFYSMNIYLASIVVKTVETMNKTQWDPLEAYNLILKVIPL